LRSARSAERRRNLKNAKQPSAARPNLCSLSVLPPENICEMTDRARFDRGNP
jgi:hypothetical protein